MDSKEGMAAPSRPLSVKTMRSEPATKLQEDEKRGGKGWGVSHGEVTEEEPISPIGRVFFEPTFNLYIVAMLGCAEPIEVDVVKAGLEATLIPHPRFSSIPVLDHGRGKRPQWVRVAVAMEAHLVAPELTPGPSPEKVVEDYVAALSRTTLDPSRPLWDLHLLNIRTSDAAAVAVLRAHHSLGDCTSLTSLLISLTHKPSNPAALSSYPSTARRRRPPPLLLRPWAALVLGWHTLVDAVLFAASLAFLKDTPTPLTGPVSELSPKRFAHCSMSLDDLKEIKKAMNCTINDVILGVVSAGLYRYLSRRYGESDDGEGQKEKKTRNKLPGNIRLRSLVVVNLRSRGGIPALAEMMEKGKKRAKWGNPFGFLLLKLPVVKYEDPLDYVRKGTATAERKKKSLAGHLPLNPLYVKTFGSKATAAVVDRALHNTTVLISNVVGPSEQIAFYGHPIVYLATSVYGQPKALTIHVQSYMNTMKVILAVDELVIPDPHQLLNDFADSLELIKKALPIGRKGKKNTAH